MQPRRKQASLTIRSDRALARLALLTRDGRSQARVIEEALDLMPLPQEPPPPPDLEERKARIMEIIDRLAATDFPTMAEFDAEEYDEFGNPR